jgi:hypothetical protein
MAYLVGFVWFPAGDMPEAANKVDVFEQKGNA